MELVPFSVKVPEASMRVLTVVAVCPEDSPNSIPYQLVPAAPSEAPTIVMSLPVIEDLLASVEESGSRMPLLLAFPIAFPRIDTFPVPATIEIPSA